MIKESRIKSQREADEFTRLTLQEDVDDILQMKKEIKIDDIFKAESDESKRVRLVVVEGAPGIGKSTFALELCRQWPKKSLQCFYLVVLLRLRETKVRTAKYIRDLFWGGESHDPSIIYKEVSKENGKGVLFVFDGFDEYPPELRSSDSDSPVMNLLRGTRELPEATILVTSRPSVKTALQPLMRNKNTKHIEIVGFGEEGIQKYASSVFGSESEMLIRFNEYLSVNPVVKSMMYNPLNCSIITEVYQATSEAGRPIPDTQTQLYTEMTLWRLSRYLRSNDPNAKIPPSFSKVPPDLSSSNLYQQVVKMVCELPSGNDLYQRLVTLGKFALEGKRKETVIYDDVNLPSECLDLGLLVEHRALYGRSESATYNFFHLTMQEYMSAFYIAQLPADEQKSLFLKRGNSMNVVWRFVAGLTKMKEIGWDTVYGEKMSTLFVECVFEAQDVQSVCDQHVFKSQEVEYASSELLSSYGAIALSYCISGHNISWNLHIKFSPGIIGYLLFKTHRTLHFIKSLNFTECMIDSSAFHDFAKCIPHLNSLISLDISGPEGTMNNRSSPRPGDGLVKVIEALQRHRNLKSLAMTSIIGDDEVGKALLNLLQSKECCLTELKISPWGIQRFIRQILTLSTSLKSIFIDDITRDDLHDVDDLANNISTLHLHRGKGEFDGRKLGNNMIKNNKSLKELELDVYVDEDGLRNILHSLSTNATLERLLLRKCNCEHLSQDERETIDTRVKFVEF